MTHDKPDRKRLFRLAAVLLPIVMLALFDLLLGVSGLVPPQDPLLFYNRTFQEAFTPFEESGENSLAIRSDWINPGVNLRAKQGSAAGRFFLYPGFRSGQLSDPKQTGTVRIFVLGGSSAYGLYVGEEEAFSGRLRSGLAARHPDLTFEVLNLGCPGWASDRVLNLLAGLKAMEPDLFIIYSGHNELLEGARKPGMNSGHEKVGLRARFLAASNLYAWVDYLVTSLRASNRFEEVQEEVAALNAGQSLVFDPSTLPVDQRTRPSTLVLEEAAVRYHSNLQAMIELSRVASIPVLIGWPVANLWTPPTVAADDVLSRGGSPERARFLSALQTIEAGHPAAAVPDLQALAGENEQDAGVHYWLGVALVRSGQPEAGLAEFQTALNGDVRTHRISGTMERSFGSIDTGPGAAIVDLRPILRATGTEKEAATLFADHCHPTAEGHARIAAYLLPQVEELLALGPAVPTR